MNTIPPQGIGAVCIISEGKAPIPYGNRIHDELSPGLNWILLAGQKAAQEVCEAVQMILECQLPDKIVNLFCTFTN